MSVITCSTCGPNTSPGPIRWLVAHNRVVHRRHPLMIIREDDPDPEDVTETGQARPA